MKISFVNLGREHAREIASWRYDEPYAIYDYREQSVEDVVAYLTASAKQCFAVLQDDQVVGFRSFGLDGRVQGGDYDDHFLDTGGGLRPDLTGRGLGECFLRKGIAFGAEKFGCDRFRVTVAAFNQRALRVCEKVGFVENHRFNRFGDDLEFVVMILNQGEIE